MPLTSLRRFTAAFLLALMPDCVWALTYVVDPDDPVLPLTERVARLERRRDRLEVAARDIRSAGQVIGLLVNNEGKPLVAALKEKVATFQSARATGTVRTALGEGDKRGLRWHCDQASKLLPRLNTMADDVGRAGQAYLAVLKGVQLGGNGSAAALASAIGDLQTTLQGSIDRAQPDSLRTPLKEIDQGLAFTWGAFTTWRQLAAAAETQARALDALGPRLEATAAKLVKPIADFENERTEVLGVAQALMRQQIDADIRNRLDRVTGVEKFFVGSIRFESASSYGESAAYWRQQWQATAKQSSAEVYDAIKPLHEAATLCGDDDNPSQQFSRGRGAAARVVSQAVNAIDNAGSARMAALDAELKTLDKALAVWRGVLQESMDKSSAVWRLMEAAPAGSARQLELRQQFDRLTVHRKKAQGAVEVIPQTQAACQAELAMLKRRLPGLLPHTQALQALFPKEG